MNKSFQFKSVKTRLTIWFLLVSLIPLILFAAIIYSQRVKVIEQRSYEKLSAIRDLKVTKLKMWIHERSSDNKTASQDYEISYAALSFFQQDQLPEDSITIINANQRKRYP